MVKLNQATSACEAFSQVLELASKSDNSNAWAQHRIGAHRGLAHCLQSQKDFSKALIEIDAALLLTTDQFAEMIPALNQTKGWILMDLKQPASACQAFLLSKNALPKNADPSDKAGIGFALSRCHQEQKDFNQALSDVETALKYAPAKSSVALNLHTSRGWIESALNQPKQACDAFESAIALIPKNQIKDRVDLNRGSASCYIDLKDFARAHIKVDEALRVAHLANIDMMAELLELKGKIFLGQLKDHLAREFFNKALAASHDNAQKVRIYSHFIRAEDFQGTINAYENILRLLDPKSPEYLANERAYFLLNLRQILQSSPDSDLLLRKMKEVESLSEKNEDLLLNFQIWRLFDAVVKKLDIHSENSKPEILAQHGLLTQPTLFTEFFWGQFYLNQTQLDQAREKFSKILEIEPRSPAGFAGLENVSIREYKFVDTFRYFMKAKNEIKNDHWDWFVQIPVRQVLDRGTERLSPNEAAALVKALAPIIPQYENVLYSGLANYYLSKDLLDDSQRTFQMVMDHPEMGTGAHPEYPYVGLGLVACNRGDFEKSDKYFAQALKITGDGLFELNRMSECYTRLHNPRAKDVYHRIIKNILHPTVDVDLPDETVKLSHAYLELGNWAVEDGDPKEAKENYDQVIKLGIADHIKIAHEKMASLKTVSTKVH